MSDVSDTKADALGTGGTSEQPSPASSRTSLPLFYRSPEVLEPARHGGLALVDKADYRFAAGANAIPINSAEYPLAARNYPIVFTGGATAPTSIAVLGLRQGQNVFVDGEGAWETDAYIPAYVRRFPFILARGGEEPRYTLCVERADTHIVEGGAHRLFDGETLTDTAKKALNFCVQYEAEAQATERFAKALVEHDLLVVNQARFSLPSGDVLALTDFKVVDEAKFNALSDEAFLELRRAGVLAAIYCHLVSMRAWQALVRRAGATS